MHAFQKFIVVLFHKSPPPTVETSLVHMTCILVAVVAELFAPQRPMDQVL